MKKSDGLGSEIRTEKTEDIGSYSEVFDKQCGFYLSFGMRYEDYWDGKTEMVKFYRDKNQADIDRRNQELWLLGGYFYTALLNVSPVLVPFNKNPKPMPYLEHPIRITPETEEEKEKRLLEESKQNMMKFMEKFKKNFKSSQ